MTAEAGVYALGYRHRCSNFISERCNLAKINRASMVHGVRRPAAAVVVLAPSAASLVLGQTVRHHVHTLHATDHDSPVHRPDHHRHHVHLSSSVLDLNSHPLREVVVGRSFDLGSLSQTMDEEGIDLALNLVGLGESSLVVRACSHCRYFVVGVYRLGYSEGVEDSCFVKGCRKCLTVLIVLGMGYRKEFGLVIGTENSAGRRLVSECASWGRSLKEDLGRIGLVDHDCSEANCIAQDLS